MGRRQPGGYFWNQTVNEAEQAEQDARKHVEALGRMENSGAASGHLLRIALDLATIQNALHELGKVDGRSTDGD